MNRLLRAMVVDGIGKTEMSYGGLQCNFKDATT